jgi:predicted RNA methylase
VPDDADGSVLEVTEEEYLRAKRLDQYFTQPALAKKLVELADIQPGARVLEPSCGGGDIAQFIRPDANLTMCDVCPAQLAIAGRRVWGRTGELELYDGDFRELKRPSNAFDVAIMNPPYGYVGSGKLRKAADRLHVQHALRMAPDVFCLVRANFLWGQERYEHVLRFARVIQLVILVHRPSFHGPALLPGQDSARHDFGILHLRRTPASWPKRDPSTTAIVPMDAPFDRRQDELKADHPVLHYWTDDWRLAA